MAHDHSLQQALLAVLAAEPRVRAALVDVAAKDGVAAVTGL